MVTPTDVQIVVADRDTPGSPAYLEDSIRNAKHQALWLEKSVVPFVDTVAELRSLNWKDALKSKPKTWDRFCIEVLGFPRQYIEKLNQGVNVLKDGGHTGEITKRQALGAVIDTAKKAKPLAEHGGDRKSENADQGDNVTLKGRGNDPAYLTARIARDRPDILERMKAGEFDSVRAAAIEAGIIKFRGIVYRLQRLWEKATKEQRDEFLNWTEAM